VKTFLARKWSREIDYRLIKELWTFSENRIAVRFAYEWHDDSGNWYRSYGNENWEFDAEDLMRRRLPSLASATCRFPKALASTAGRSGCGRTIILPSAIWICG
jgi:nuclear transport factor 2 (NTF2) superfamily protein